MHSGHSTNMCISEQNMDLNELQTMKGQNGPNMDIFYQT
jgi:hypothetical protein